VNAVELLEEMSRLMALKGENPFKIRAFEKAVDVVAGRDDLEARAKAGTLTELSGIGKGISEVLTDFFLHGKSRALEEMKSSLPPGLLELTEIPGLGPKKAMVLIEELGIQSVGELEYACRENRLLKMKGFGEKTQNKIMEGIQFRKTNQGFQRLDEAFPVAEKLTAVLTGVSGGARISESGALRRRLEVLDRLEFLVEDTASSEKISAAVEDFKKSHSAVLPIEVRYSDAKHFGYELAKSTGTKEHWAALGSPEKFAAADEEKFFGHLKLDWIAPEFRETGEEVRLAKTGALNDVLPWTGVQGVFHNHTTRSDGTASLEEMVIEAKAQGYRYIGISDHSQTAFYASGLTADALKDQEKEIRTVQEKHPEIRIFWGIESDILADGSLDYPDSVLKKFDFVIASVHSRFGMDREAMTDRLLEAIRNPYTRFLGHATGRILLGRKAYDIDMPKIIAEAARHDVAIELNANPARLDIDWRWGAELRRMKTKISINPDAHATDELENTRFGIAMARKALIPSVQVINSLPTDKVEQWLKRQN
jgi:DNA polymerase (family 10)